MDIDIPVSDQERVELGRRITEEITQLLEDYGPDHPLIDGLIQKRLMDILSIRD